MRVVFEIDDNHSYDLYDYFGWFVDFEELPSPSPRTNYVSIPSRNGYLDLTEVNGQVYFDPVKFTLIARKILKKGDDIISQVSTLKNTFHGKRVRVYLGGSSEYPETYYYDSRLDVKGVSRDSLLVEVEIECTAFPYRLAKSLTTETFTITQERQEVVIYGMPMPVVPSITTNAEMFIAYDEYRVTIGPGENIIVPDIVLTERIDGAGNMFYITGNGTISFTYQKGKF